LINIYPDGTVSFTTSGIEMGQGLFTKVAQAIAMSFNIPLSLIRVKDTSTLTVPGASATGGSVGSETCVQSALLACGAMNERLEPIRKVQ
jgi:xanthine dehydrogenase molybdopterin-binding subunit B